MVKTKHCDGSNQSSQCLILLTVFFSQVLYGKFLFDKITTWIYLEDYSNQLFYRGVFYALPYYAAIGVYEMQNKTSEMHQQDIFTGVTINGSTCYLYIVYLCGKH